MKKTLLAVLFISAALHSCKKDDKIRDYYELNSTFKYTDNEGSWSPPQVRMGLFIYESNQFSCDGNLCNLDGSNEIGISGNLNLSDSSINSNGCKLYFSVWADTMMVYYPDCDSLCKALFIKK